MAIFTETPSDILKELSTHLTSRDLWSLRLVCKRFYWEFAYETYRTCLADCTVDVSSLQSLTGLWETTRRCELARHLRNLTVTATVVPYVEFPEGHAQVGEGLVQSYRSTGIVVSQVRQEELQVMPSQYWRLYVAARSPRCHLDLLKDIILRLPNLQKVTIRPARLYGLNSNPRQWEIWLPQPLQSAVLENTKMCFEMVTEVLASASEISVRAFKLESCPFVEDQTWRVLTPSPDRASQARTVLSRMRSIDLEVGARFYTDGAYCVCLDLLPQSNERLEDIHLKMTSSGCSLSDAVSPFVMRADFPRLGTCKFTSICTQSDALCTFLRRHCRSLRTLHLEDCSLLTGTWHAVLEEITHTHVTNLSLFSLRHNEMQLASDVGWGDTDETGDDVLVYFVVPVGQPPRCLRMVKSFRRYLWTMSPEFHCLPRPHRYGYSGNEVMVPVYANHFVDGWHSWECRSKPFKSMLPQDGGVRHQGVYVQGGSTFVRATEQTTPQNYEPFWHKGMMYVRLSPSLSMRGQSVPGNLLRTMRNGLYCSQE